MRPIIGVNGDCLWLCGDVCHSPPSISAPPLRSHEKLRRRLTGTGVGSNFRFVGELDLKPASISVTVLMLRRCCSAKKLTCNVCNGSVGHLLDIMLGCIFITYVELNMIHIVGYLTVNTLFIVLHSIENPSLFTNNIRDFCDI